MESLYVATLVHAFVTSRVDHCNGLLHGSHSYLLDRLQSARLVLNITKFSGSAATAIRDEIHWLSIRKLIKFKIVLLVRHRMIGAAVRTWIFEGTVPVPVSVLRRVYKASGLLLESTSSSIPTRNIPHRRSLA